MHREGIPACGEEGCHCLAVKAIYEQQIQKAYQENVKLKQVVQQYTVTRDLLKEYLSKNDVINMEKEIIREEVLRLLQTQEVKDEKMHLAVLYSSPLGYEEADGRGGKRFKPMQQLRFTNELAQISQALKRSENAINYSYRLGTSFNFIQSRGSQD